MDTSNHGLVWFFLRVHSTKSMARRKIAVPLHRTLTHLSDVSLQDVTNVRKINSFLNKCVGRLKDLEGQITRKPAVLNRRMCAWTYVPTGSAVGRHWRWGTYRSVPMYSRVRQSHPFSPCRALQGRYKYQCSTNNRLAVVQASADGDHFTQVSWRTLFSSELSSHVPAHWCQHICGQPRGKKKRQHTFKVAAWFSKYVLD